MPFINIQVPQGAWDADKKARAIKTVTDAVVETCGHEKIRERTFVTIEELKEGNFGVGGEVKTLADIRQCLEKGTCAAT